MILPKVEQLVRYRRGKRMITKAMDCRRISNKKFRHVVFDQPKNADVGRESKGSVAAHEMAISCLVCEE